MASLTVSGHFNHSLHRSQHPENTQEQSSLFPAVIRGIGASIASYVTKWQETRQFTRELQKWVHEPNLPNPHEYDEREKVAQKILKAFKEGSTNLNLHSLFVSSLPECIGHLQKLQSLGLYNMGLRYLPESIGRLENLTHLDLLQNHLISLPESLGTLPKLQIVNLLSNPNLEPLPQSLAGLPRHCRIAIENANLFTSDLRAAIARERADPQGQRGPLIAILEGEDEDSVNRLLVLTHSPLRRGRSTLLPNNPPAA